MNPASWEHAKDVITEALRHAPAEREQFVRQRCADTSLADEIITLINAYGEHGDFLADSRSAGNSASDDEELEPGTRVGPYVIIDSIGRGGMGHVFLGSDPRLRRKVALKCVIRSLAGSGERRLRILHEARAAASVAHPNVATIHDVVEHENRAFIVMEYVEGESLSARLKRERLPIDRVVAIGRQLTSALAAAHAKHIVHRDLKPGNVHFATDGTVKVLDFGIANVPRLATTVASDRSTLATSSQMTARGPQPGTPPYMSPEQLMGRGVDERSDIYSLGVVLFEMATGRRPHLESDAATIVVSMANGTPRADKVDAQVPGDLADVIARALALDVEDRFQSAAEVVAALEQVERRLADKREPIRRRIARIGIVMLSIPTVLGAIGFIATTGFNLTFGRTGAFAEEPFYMYFVWGQRAVSPSIVMMILAAVVFVAGRFALRVAELAPAVQRLMTRMRVRGREIASRLSLDQPAGLAQASVALALVTLTAMCWYHADLIRAWMYFISTAPTERLRPLEQANLQRLYYRLELDVVTLIFAFLLFKVIRLQKKQRTSEGTAPIALFAGIIAVMVLMNEWPYRILLHSDFERVDAGGAACYVIGESSAEFLLFCPGSDPPRNRTVKRDDPTLHRTGVRGNVFETLKNLAGS